MEHLVAAGADVNAKRNDGVTALWLAAQEGHTEVVNVLLAAKADVNAKKNDGGTALMAAAVNGHLPVVERLLAAGADTNTRAEGYTPLEVAKLLGRGDVVEVLKKAGAKE